MPSQTKRIGKMPPLTINNKRQHARYQPGEKATDPIQCGRPDPSVLMYVEARGMAYGIRHGDRRWVTGTEVMPGLTSGSFLEVEPPEPPPVIDRTPQPPVVQPMVDSVPTFMCRDCTHTWKAGARVECTCDPVDEDEWVKLG